MMYEENFSKLNMSAAEWNAALHKISEQNEGSVANTGSMNMKNPQSQPMLYQQCGSDVQYLRQQLTSMACMQNKINELEAISAWREGERDRRKAEIDVLTVGDDGALYVQTVTTRKTHPRRYVANFKNPTMKIFVNLKTGETAYVFECQIGSESRRLVISERYCGNMHVFLQKLRSIGATFLVSKSSEEVKMAEELWCTLRNTSSVPEFVPDDTGWYKDLDKKIKFAKEGTKTWKSLIM